MLEIDNEREYLLMQVIYKTYFFGVKRFPNDMWLKISFALFIFEKLNMGQ